jgi:glycosyltransferase involved in cell wall biosynthesis
MTGTPTSLVLVANARMPSQRAQSLQVAQVAGAFARAGTQTTLMHALRRDTSPVADQDELWEYYGLPTGKRPCLQGIPNYDWIDSVPRKLQFFPARIQELSFARKAASWLSKSQPDAFVLSREVECALELVRKGRENVFTEIHRVPGGKTRRRWLLEASAKTTGTLAISGGVREDLIELGLDPNSILVEHDGFEPRRFENQPSRPAAREALGIDGAAKLVVYTGGLLAWKGVDILVQAARLLPEVQFVIAGGMDQDVALLKGQAGGLANLRFDGFQPPERVGLYLAAGDIGVVPNRSTPAISARYTSPLKVFEAKACGLPLVVSDLFSMRDVLSEEEAQFCAPDDPRALADGIDTLLGDSAKREAMARRMTEEAVKSTWDARAMRILAWMGERSAS